MPTPKSVVDEKRDIKAVHYERGGGHEVGEEGITSIEAYEENGQMAPVPWIAVYKHGEIYERIPVQQVVVQYKEPPKQPETSDFEPDDDLPF
mgnify:CR=1 FL=1